MPTCWLAPTTRSTGLWCRPRATRQPSLSRWVAGGAPHAPSDDAVAAAVAKGAGVTPANVTLTLATNPDACADVCRTWDVRVQPADAAAAARLRVSLDAGANRSILRRVLETARADAATYNYVGGLVEGDRAADVVTELGGAAGAGGLAPGAIAGIVVGGVVVRGGGGCGGGGGGGAAACARRAVGWWRVKRERGRRQTNCSTREHANHQRSIL